MRFRAVPVAFGALGVILAVSGCGSSEDEKEAIAPSGTASSSEFSAPTPGAEGSTTGAPTVGGQPTVSPGSSPAANPSPNQSPNSSPTQPPGAGGMTSGSSPSGSGAATPVGTGPSDQPGTATPSGSPVTGETNGGNGGESAVNTPGGTGGNGGTLGQGATNGGGNGGNPPSAGGAGTGGAETGGSDTGGSGGSLPTAEPSTGGDGGTGGDEAAGDGGSSGDATGGSAGSGMTDPPEELRAFPGAEGFGRDASGGRGTSVCHVTTLSDSGPGSLRDCVSQSNRTVVFDVGGWITLSSNLGITQNNLTIAGQTAPGNGIGVRGRKLSVGGQNIVLRYLRVRRGIVATTDRDDAMTVSSAASNVIIDHCSIGYGTDEVFSLPGDEGRGPRNLTVQWSIVAWGLQRNNHSAGSLLTSNQTTIHHTLWAFNKTRNPRARSEEPGNRGQGGHLDWVNNVIYGWNAPDPVGEAEGWSLSYHPFILAGTSNGQHAANAVGNYFISARSATAAFVNGTPNFRLFFENNLLDGNANGSLDVSRSGTDMISGEPTLLTERLPGPLVVTDTPEVAYQRVMADVGATFPARDEADTLLVSQVQNQTGILIQSERDLIALGVGADGYGTLPNVSRPAGFDSDGDGMPDAWETANGFNPNNPADGNGDADGDGYTNLEEYLNGLVQ